MAKIALLSEPCQRIDPVWPFHSVASLLEYPPTTPRLLIAFPESPSAYRSPRPCAP